MQQIISKTVVFVLAMLISTLAYAQVQVFAQVESGKDIYIGEGFGYHIIIDGENQAGQVDLTPLAEYNPQSAGSRDVSQTSISIINGKTSQSVVKRYVMSYFLTVQQARLIRLPPVTVTVGGVSYQTNPVEVNILKPGSTDKLELEVTLSQQQCYIGQAVIMTVKFFVFSDIGEFGFNIPVFSSDLFFFENPDVVNPQAKQFRLNNTIPEPVFVTQSSIVRSGREATLLSFSKVLIPKKSGQITIEPFSVSADVVVGRSRDFFGFQPQYKRFMVSSASLSLTVLPLPAEGRLADFYGLVGQYTISASAEPVKVNVGDPITLTIKIGGNKYLKPVQWPELEQIPEMAANFKIPSQKASPTIEGDYKVFTQTIRANNDKVTAIPAIPLVFFDTDKGRYETAKTEPIKLEVAATKILTNADLEGRDFTPVNKEVEAIRKGLSANYEGPDVLTNMGFSPLAALFTPLYAPLWAIPLAGFLLSLLSKFLTHTTPEKTAQKRRRSAYRRAVKQLKKVHSAPPVQRNELLASIMKQYLGERFDRIAGSLTAQDCFDIVAAVSDKKTAAGYRELIDHCEAVRYASTNASLDPVQIKEAIELLRTVEKRSKK